MVATSSRLIGELRLQQTLAHLRARTSDLRDAFSKIREDFLALQAHRFGRGAPAVSMAYAAWKARHFPGAGPLVRTGRLRGGATGQNRDFRVVQRPLSLRLVISTPYAIFHARWAMPLDPGDRERWMGLVERHIAAAVKGR